MKNKITIIALVFLFGNFKATAQNLFNQDFNTSNTLADYFNATSAGANQFDYISDFGNSPASVNEGVFSFNKIGGSSAYIIRNTNISESATFMKLQMRVRFSSPTSLAATSSGEAAICIGDGTSDAWVLKNNSATAVPGNAETFARFTLLYTVDLNAVSFRTGGSNVSFSGWQDITIFCNKTTGAVSYVGPDNGAPTTVNSGFADLWIGTTKVRANARPQASSSTIDLKKLKIVFPSQLQNMKTEIDYIKIWNESVLPVSLTGFSGKQHNSGVKLSWQTISEQNNSHFSILKSIDGVSFKPLATIEGKGNLLSTSTYTYNDYNVLQGINYYKLRQVDFDGKTEEYEPIAVSFGISNAPMLKVELVSDKSISLGINTNKRLRNGILQISDINGRKIHHQNIQLEKGLNHVELNNLNVGRSKMYIVSLKADNYSKAVKFIAR